MYNYDFMLNAVVFYKFFRETQYQIQRSDI